ncbi:hypothetical protein HY251_09865 [bacterium]|nr:hypothetical protein [bacterium]
MPHKFGRHVAGEIVIQATKFIENAKDPLVWSALTDKVTGRFSEADLEKGKKLLKAATEAQATSEKHKGDTLVPTHEADDAQTAADKWLHNQLAHARGLLHEMKDTKTLEALDEALSNSKARGAVSKNVRAYVKLVEAKDVTGAALSASYLDKHSRDAILKDGLHLADALDAKIAAPAAAKGSKGEATATKDDSTDDLARWLRRWSLVAHDVVSHAGLVKLSLDTARHHPAHRKGHPAVTGKPAPTA